MLLRSGGFCVIESSSLRLLRLRGRPKVHWAGPADLDVSLLCRNSVRERLDVCGRERCAADAPVTAEDFLDDDPR